MASFKSWSERKKEPLNVLSRVVLKILRTFYKKYGPREYLFVRRTPSGKNRVNSALIRTMCARGVDLRFIQELLGHCSSKTSEIYTQVSKNFLGKTLNPLDQALRRSKEK
jgi:integrase